MYSPPPDVLAEAEKFDELIPGSAFTVAALNEDLAGREPSEIRRELDRRLWSEDRLLHYLRCSHIPSRWHERELAEALRTGDH